MILTADTSQRPDPLQGILAGGLGLLGQAIQNSISLGKGRADLQNSQGAQFFDLLQQEQEARNRRFEFAVGQGNKDRDYGRGVLESDRAYDRNVLTSDRSFGRGVFESDRTFSYGVVRDGVADEKSDRDFILREKSVESNISFAEKAEERASTSHALDISRSVEDAQARQLALEETSNEKARELIARERASKLFDKTDAGYVPKKGVDNVTLQDFIANNANTKDPQMVSRVNSAKVNLDRSIQSATKEQLAPQVESLAKEISALKQKLAAPEALPKTQAAALSKNLATQQELLNKYVERFPEFSKILQKFGASSGGGVESWFTDETKK